MIRRLKIKFVCVNMAIVVVMLGAIFAALLFSTQRSLEREGVEFLRQAAASPLQMLSPGERQQLAQSPYFFLDVTPEGEILAVGSNSYDLEYRGALLPILTMARRSADQVGVLEDYNLRFYQVRTPTSHRILFADISSERHAMESLTRGCLAAGAASLVVFFLISLGLAQWAVRPVEEAWRRQKQFVADASHELKTPLTVILANAQLIRDSGCDPAQLPQRVERIAQESVSMRGLVEQLLELARADSGIPAGQRAQVDLSRLVNDRVMAFEPVLFENGHLLGSRVEEGIALWGSAPRLERVLEALLDNANKYAAPGGAVHVELRRLGRRHCLLTVASQGNPIPPALRQKIFHRFFRGDEARAAQGSYGLGLPIAQEAVRAHGGKIWVETVADTNLFCVRLPLRRAGWRRK